MEHSMSDEDSEHDVMPQQLLCMACLCGGRATRRPRDQALIEYYTDIVSDVLSSPASVPAPRLCWECEAQLRRALHFTHQVRECFATLQQTLRALGAQGLSACLPVGLSRVPRLQRCTINVLDIPAESLVSSEHKEAMSSDTEELGFRDTEELVPSDSPVVEEYVHEMPLLVEIKDEPQECVNDDPLILNMVEKTLGGKGASALEESLQRWTYIYRDTEPATTSEATTTDTIVSTAQTVGRTSELSNPMSMSTATGDLSFKCTTCGKTFIRKKSLIAHMNIHTVDKPYKCLICQITFGQIGTFKSHIMKTHTAEKSYGCPFCQNVFSNCSELISHIMTEKPYKCTICLKGFKKKYDLNLHMRTHTGERLFECAICQKSFVQSGQLKVHMKNHTGEQSVHECSICQSSFTSGYKLKVHMHSHTGKKPFECSICQRDFYENRLLKCHMNTHTGEKPYKCTFCKKDFYYSGNLHDHIKTHTGVKPYKCSVCQKECTKNSTLKRHMRTHTGEKLYKCTVCQRGFSERRNLKGHMKTHTR